VGIAEADNINSSYVSRVLRVKLLAPQIVEATSPDCRWRR
jgi:hypothetical protein